MRSTVRRIAALAAALSCLPVSPVHASATPRAQAAPAQSRAQVQLVVDEISPVTRPKGAQSRVTLSGSVANLTGQDIAGLSVRLRYRGTPLSSRYELIQHTQGTGLSLPGIIATQTVAQVSGANSRHGWKLATTAQAMHLTEFGVYPVAVDVLNGAQQVITSRTTFLNFVPAEKTFRPTKIAWVWPLIDRQHRAAGPFLDERLERDLAPSGRLGGLVGAAKATDTPVTWAVDPALLDDARTMAGENGYRLRASDGRTSRRPTSTAAGNWLKELRSAMGSDPFFTVPYADPDAVALVRNGLSSHLKAGYRHAAIVKDEDLLNRAPTASIAWPAQGAADQRTLDRMAAYGSDTFLMTSDVLIPQNRTYTWPATTRLHAANRDRTTLAYDSTLSKIVSADSRSPGAATLTAQRFLAETAMITAEVPAQRTVVVVPSRSWNPDPAFARKLLEYTSGADWLAEVPLDGIAKAAPHERTFIGYQPIHEQHEIGATFLKQVKSVAVQARLLSSVLQPPADSHERGLLRVESVSWRGRSRAARAARERLADELEGQVDDIRLVVTKRYTVAGKSGHLLITVANDLTDRTARVRLKVTSRNPGLQIGAYEVNQVLGPGEKNTVRVVVQASGNVSTPVDLELLTPEGRALGRPATVTVRTTGYGRDALLITGGALAVLFVGVGTRAVRARRRAAVQADRPEDGDGAED